VNAGDLDARLAKLESDLGLNGRGSVVTADDHERAEREAIVTEPSHSADWPAPEDFDASKLPDFPVEKLPSWLGEWSLAEAVFTQSPVDLSACIGLAAASLPVARSFHVEVRPGWSEPCNLWLVVAADPGEKKSPVFSAATAPVHAFVHLRAKELAPKIAARQQERRVLEAKIKAAEDAAVKGKAYDGCADALQAAREIKQRLDGQPELRAPVLIADDCTPEALVVLLSQHGERMGIFSSEGGPFELMAGRYSDKGGNFEIYLKAHPGDPHVVNRIGRADPVSLFHPLVTMGLTVQPSVIASLSTKEGFRGKGLLARFLYSMPQTALGHRQAEPPAVPEPVSTTYQAALASLLTMPLEPRTLSMSPEVTGARVVLHDELEPRMGPDGDLHPIRDWVNKLVGSVARIAGVLHVADHALALADMPLEIPVETFNRATTIARYFLAHALAAFAVMRADEDVELAKRVWAWAHRKGLRSFTAREAARAVHAVPAETIEPALAKLLDRNLVRMRPRPKPSPGGGRAPSDTYDVNPRATA
jgi:replicative DNA helicase